MAWKPKVRAGGILSGAEAPEMEDTVPSQVNWICKSYPYYPVGCNLGNLRDICFNFVSWLLYEDLWSSNSIFFSDKFCKDSFWKLLSLCSNPVLHLMISLALACSASRLCPVETETAKIMTNFCAFVAYQIHRKAMTSAGCFPLWPATQMLQQNHEGKSHLRIWGHGCLQRDLQCSRPDHEPCIGWCLVEYPDGLTLDLDCFCPISFCNFWGGCNSERNDLLYIRQEDSGNASEHGQWCAKKMMGSPCATCVLIHRLKRKPASWPGLQGPYLWLTQDVFVALLKNAFDLDFTR